MIPKQFVDAVREMRRLQKEYQKTGNMRVRGLMTDKEKDVDWLIQLYDNELERIKPKQMEFHALFYNDADAP